LNYVLNDNGSVKFDFVDGSGNVESETYSPRQRGPGGGDRPPRNRPPRDNPPPPKDPPRGKKTPETSGANMARPERSSAKTGIAVSSSAIVADGMLPVAFSCDGQSASPIQWKGAPAGTKSFTLSLWHTVPDQEKSYSLVYNIPVNVDHLSKNDNRTGTVGLNYEKRAAYDKMCSKGPGVKKYHVTVYALSFEPKLAKGCNNRASLLKAIKNVSLAETTLDFQYKRKK